jgi:hypothetical protein
MTINAEHHRNGAGDFVRHFDSPLVVTGFFTPDYTAAAASFASNLSEHAISHHLYHRSKIGGGGWVSQTRQKPSVLSQARIDYPDRILVLMDVDCRVRGDISGILDAPGDLALRTKRTTLGSTFSRRYALKPCSRVVLARPTPGSAAFVAAWKAVCDSRQGGCDEALLMQSMADSPDYYSVGTLSLRYAGLELRDAPPDAIVVHDSIRDVSRPAWAVRKRIQTYFRTARDAAFQATTGKTYAETYSKRGRRPNLAGKENSQR